MQSLSHRNCGSEPATRLVFGPDHLLPNHHSAFSESPGRKRPSRPLRLRASPPGITRRTTSAGRSTPGRRSTTRPKSAAASRPAPCASSSADGSAASASSASRRWTRDSYSSLARTRSTACPFAGSIRRT